jgi:hypothetical protein
MLYEVTAFGSYYNQEIINRWNYLSTGVPAAVSGSFGLTFALGAIPEAGVLPPTGMFSAILGSVSAGYTLNSLVVRAASLFDPEDFYETPYVPPRAGSQGIEFSMSPIDAYGFRTNRVRLDIDRGTKRFVGATENSVDAGGVISAGTLTALNTVASRMSAVLSYDDEGNTITYSPCIVQKQRYTAPSGKFAYRYYPTLVEQLAHIATGIQWQPYSTIRSQTSRQYNRGA